MHSTIVATTTTTTTTAATHTVLRKALSLSSVQIVGVAVISIRSRRRQQPQPQQHRLHHTNNTHDDTQQHTKRRYSNTSSCRKSTNVRPVNCWENIFVQNNCTNTQTRPHACCRRIHTNQSNNVMLRQQDQGNFAQRVMEPQSQRWMYHPRFMCAGFATNQNQQLLPPQKKKKSATGSRKRKLLGGSLSHTVTTKDRLRLLMDTNQVIPKNRFDQSVFSVAPAKDLLDLAQSRLSYVRNTVYQYWNPDYTEEPTTTTKTTNGTATESSPQIRTYKSDFVVMDTRWWVWNTLLAVMPAMVIVIYCELRGKPMMYEYHHQLEVEQLRQILGEDEFTIERANAIIKAKNKDRDEKEGVMSGDIDEIIYKLLRKVGTKIYQTMHEKFVHVWEEIYPQNTQDTTTATDKATNQNNDGTNSTAVVVHSRIDEENYNNSNNGNGNHAHQNTSMKNTIPVPQDGTETAHQPQQQQQQQQQSTAHKSKSVMNVTDDPSIEILIHRIQQMEDLLRQQQQQQAPSPLQNTNAVDVVAADKNDDDAAIRMIGQRMKHMNQSNVQNRFEIDSKQKWKKYITEIPDDQQPSLEVNPNATTDNRNKSYKIVPIPTTSSENNAVNDSSTAIETQQPTLSPPDSTTSTAEQFLHPYAVLFLQTVGWLRDGIRNNDINNVNQRDINTNNDDLTNVVEYPIRPPPPSLPTLPPQDDGTVQETTKTSSPTIVDDEIQQQHDPNVAAPSSSCLTQDSMEKLEPPDGNNPQQQHRWWKRFWR